MLPHAFSAHEGQVVVPATETSDCPDLQNSLHSMTFRAGSHGFACQCIDDSNRSIGQIHESNEARSGRRTSEMLYFRQAGLRIAMTALA